MLRHGQVIQYYFTVQNEGVRTYYVNPQGQSVVYIRPSSVLEARRFPLDDYRYQTLTPPNTSPKRTSKTSRKRKRTSVKESS